MYIVRENLSYIIGFSILLALVWLVGSVGVHTVGSGYMAPTYAASDLIFYNKNSTGIDTLEREDVILYRQHRNDPTGQEDLQYHVGRVIGLPGDYLEYRDGLLYRNGQRVQEMYVQEEGREYIDQVHIPADHVWVMMDNRGSTIRRDSIQFGPISEFRIVGQPFH